MYRRNIVYNFLGFNHCAGSDWHRHYPYWDLYLALPSVPSSASPVEDITILSSSIQWTIMSLCHFWSWRPNNASAKLSLAKTKNKVLNSTYLKRRSLLTTHRLACPSHAGCYLHQSNVRILRWYREDMTYVSSIQSIWQVSHTHQNCPWAASPFFDFPKRTRGGINWGTAYIRERMSSHNMSLLHRQNSKLDGPICLMSSARERV